MFPSRRPLNPFERISDREKTLIKESIGVAQRIRHEALEAFTEIPEGINIERVSGFSKSLGLVTSPVIFLRNKDEELKFKQIFEKHSQPFNNEELYDSDSWAAIYDSDIDLIILRDNKDFLSLDPIDKEWYLMHEQGHASCQHSTSLLQNNAAFKPRIGFSITHKDSDFGEFLEEGFCDFLAAEYRNKYRTPELMNTFFPYTIGDLVDLNASVEFEEMGLEIPAKYIIVLSDKSMAVTENVYSGYAFCLLTKLNPKILEISLQARSDPKMLARLAFEIDKIRPGLYLDLRKLQYNEEDFLKGLQMIQEIPISMKEGMSDGGVEKTIDINSPESFNKAIVDVGPRLLHVCRIICNGTPDSVYSAEDLCSDVRLRAMEKIKSYKGGNFFSWLTKIANRTFLNIVRHNAVERGNMSESVRRDSFSENGHNLSPEEILLERQKEKFFNGLGFTPRQEEVLRLKMQGLTFKEIGERLGISTDTASSLYSRALSKARKEWNGEKS